MDQKELTKILIEKLGEMADDGFANGGCCYSNFLNKLDLTF